MKVWHFWVGIFFSISTVNSSLLLIDTAGNDKQVYRTFLTLAQSAGFSPVYIHAYDIDPSYLDNYETIVISLDGSFFSAIARELRENNTVNSAYARHIIDIIDTLTIQKNKLIGIVIPNFNSVLLLNLSLQLLKKMKAIEKDTTIESQIQQKLEHLLRSDASKSYRYNTALLPIREKKESILSNLPEEQKQETQHSTKIFELPAHISLPLTHELSPLLPLGFYLHNTESNNQFFVTTMHAITGTDIMEAFTLNPIDTHLRAQLLELTAQMVHQLRYASIHNSLPSAPLPIKLPRSVKPNFMDQEKERLRQQRNLNPHYAWTTQGIVCGWMGIEQYQTQEAIEHLLDSGLNLLWFELNPEWYLADAALSADKRDTFLENVRNFTALLKKACEERNQKPPHIFMGTDITSNFAQKKVIHPAIDMYGKIYDKIPSPLDVQEFWQPELLTVCDRFIDLWHESVGNGLPLGGIFLDLEMYHVQQQSGQFLSLMDFSDYTWSTYSKAVANPTIAELKTTNDRVSYLLRTHTCTHYFNFLRKQAHTIGLTIKKHLKKKLPHGIIGVYNINLPYSWFYQGVLAGLSTPQEPIVLATFNNDFYSHAQNLNDNFIYALHMPVVLLSKIKNKDDAIIIKNFWKVHDGIWFNRISRLEQSRDPKDWAWDWGVETTPLDTQTFVNILHEIFTELRKNNANEAENSV